MSSSKKRRELNRARRELETAKITCAPSVDYWKSLAELCIKKLDESAALAEEEKHIAISNERIACADLCKRPAGWLSDSQQQIADEIRLAILKRGSM